MGSLGDYKKGTQPMLDRIRQHNAQYNAASERAWYAMPWWRRMAAVIGRALMDLAEGEI